MKTPWVNVLLMILLVMQVMTGYYGMISGHASQAWILWLHGIVAYMLLLVLLLKSSIIVDAWRRKKRWTFNRLSFLITLFLLLIVIIMGLLWTFTGPIYWGDFSLISLHIYIAVPLILLMFWHSWHMRFIFRVKGIAGRRLFLGGFIALAGGLLLKISVERLKPTIGVPGANRRFTGSYEAGSFTDFFPVVSWIADRPPPVDLETWSLEVVGEVERPFTISYSQLVGLPQHILSATLDCTGGWYSTQRWEGVPVSYLLAQAGIQLSAASVTFEAVSGYRRRFPIEEAKGYLLALGTIPQSTSGETILYRSLDHGHGFPARLVAPGRRGVEWVKWVSLIRVNRTGPHMQSPLPLQ